MTEEKKTIEIKKEGRPRNKYDQFKYVRTGKLSGDTLQKIEDALSIGASVTMACTHAGISRKTFYKWLKEIPSLGNRFEDAKYRIFLIAMKNIAGGLKTGDIGLSERFLARRMPDEYAETIKIRDEGGLREGGTVEEEMEIIGEFHERLKAARIKRSRERAKKDGELPEDTTI